MRTAYTDLNIRIGMGNTVFYALNIAFERFLQPMPRHSHGQDSYELHYIPYGRGRVWIDGTAYEIGPNTLYMTGPLVEHEQIPRREDPMAEYCIYFKRKQGAGETDPAAARFAGTPFWFGQDGQELYPLMQQIFYELEHQYTGYMAQVEALLVQCIVKAVRNYENRKESTAHFLPSNLVDSKYLVVEESFLYDFRGLTLEELARRLGLGVRQTERFLREHYGQTFLQKKTEAKMSMAKLYLADPKTSVSEAAERLGYSSTQHFCYAFRRYYGKTAGAYRKGLQEL